MVEGNSLARYSGFAAKQDNGGRCLGRQSCITLGDGREYVVTLNSGTIYSALVVT